MSTQNLRQALLGFFLLSLPLLSLSQSYPPLPPINPRLEKAYIALQAWKHSITSDPKNFTLNWCGPHVCNYTGVYCAPAPDDPDILTVAGIDLNHAKIAGTLPEDLGLLTDLALFHINSNRFEGTLPTSFDQLKQLYELDVSNNRLDGPFPSVVLKLPSLKFLSLPRSPPLPPPPPHQPPLSFLTHLRLLSIPCQWPPPLTLRLLALAAITIAIRQDSATWPHQPLSPQPRPTPPSSTSPSTSPTSLTLPPPTPRHAPC